MIIGVADEVVRARNPSNGCRARRRGVAWQVGISVTTTSPLRTCFSACPARIRPRAIGIAREVVRRVDVVQLVVDVGSTAFYPFR